LGGYPEGTGLTRKPKPRWEGNIKTECQEIGWEGMDSMHLAHDRAEYLYSMELMILTGVSS
jgi:hypothetical protein